MDTLHSFFPTFQTSFCLCCCRCLGDEELQLKRRRDASYSRCSDLKLKLKASQESLLQISALSPKLAFTPATASQDLNTSLPSTSKS